jgi:hypothetical protein
VDSIHWYRFRKVLDYVMEGEWTQLS